MSNIDSPSLIWFEENFHLIKLLRSEDPPNIMQVIDARNCIWKDGKDFDPNLFANLVELAILYNAKVESERAAYSILACHLRAVIKAGPNQPDLMLEDGTPVEVKIGDFNLKALKQLQRYMRAANTSKGVACGIRLVVDLPTGVEFVQIKFDQAKNEYVVVGDSQNV